jgi:biotin carboxyl carrier protein
MIYYVTMNGEEHVVGVDEVEADVYRIVVDGKEQIVDAQRAEQSVYSLLTDGRSHEANVTERPEGFAITIGGDVYEMNVVDERRRALSRQTGKAVSGTQVIAAQMPGKVMAILVEAGQQVKVGDGLLVIEAMKMENEIKSPVDGEVKEIAVQEGGTVESGQRLLVVG